MKRRRWGARKLESIGQRNDATIAGMIPTIDFSEEIGTAAIAARIKPLATLLKEASRLFGARRW